MYYFNYYYNFFNDESNNIYVLIAFIIILFLSILTKIVLYLSYKTHLTIFRFNAKDIKNIKDIKKTKATFLGRCIFVYLQFIDKGFNEIHTRNIVENEFNKIKTIGISNVILAKLVKGLDVNIILLGVLLAVVFEDYRLIYAGSILLFFILGLLANVIFNFNLIGENLKFEVIAYIELEVGKFYRRDNSSLLIDLRRELKDAIGMQAIELSSSIKKMGEDIAGVMRLSLSQIANSFEINGNKMNTTLDNFSFTIENWNQKIIKSAELQEKNNILFENINIATKNIDIVFDKMIEILNNYKNEDLEIKDNVNKQINKLIEATHILEKNSDEFINISKTIKEQNLYIQKNQELLNSSVLEYEKVISDLSKSAGDIFSSIVQFNTENVYSSLDELLSSNIKLIISNNYEVINKIKKIFEEINEETRGQKKAINQLREEIKINIRK